MAPSLTTAIRLVLLPLITTSILLPAIYQPVLNLAWRSLLRLPIYHWSSYETILTVLCYIFIEIPLTSVFIAHPEWRFQPPREPSSGDPRPRTRPRGMKRPSRRLADIGVYVLPLLLLDLTMIKKFKDVEMHDILTSGGYDGLLNGSPEPDDLPAKTFLIPTLHNFTLSSPLQLTRALPSSPPSSRRLTTELILSFIIYDFVFFLFHLGMHTLPILRRYHAPHHAHDAQLNPQVTNQLTLFERLGLVLLANFSLNVIGAHVLTRTVFVPVFVWLLVEIHCGMDLPWAYDKILPRGWGGGASKHMRHHRTGEGGFEPFFCWWDGLWEMAQGRRIKG